MDFDMTKAIEECEENKREDEVVVFAIGIGRLMPKHPTVAETKRCENKLNRIKKCAGFIGVHPIDSTHNLLVFDLLTDAMKAKDELEYKGIKLGNIVPILIEKQYYEEYLNGKTD